MKPVLRSIEGLHDGDLIDHQERMWSGERIWVPAGHVSILMKEIKDSALTLKEGILDEFEA